jgi:hypothetical protein
MSDRLKVLLQYMLPSLRYAASHSRRLGCLVHVATVHRHPDGIIVSYVEALPDMPGTQKAPKADAFEALQFKLVAGTGFEPVTFRL